MYQNRICRTPVNRNPLFFIRRYERAFGPEAQQVESACASLIESRFGLGRYVPVIVVLTDRPERVATAVDYLSDSGSNGQPRFYAALPLGRTHALSPLGRNGDQAIEAACRTAKQIELLEARPHGSNSMPLSAPNRGRGSPGVTGTRRRTS